MLPMLAVGCMAELQRLGVRKQGASVQSIEKCFSSGSVDAGFVLALPFHHGDLEPDCVGVSTRGRGEAYVRDKNTSARLCA